MQTVIDIDDNLYTRLFDNGKIDAVDMLNVCAAVRKGTILPKGHGKLKDTDKLAKEINSFKDNWDCCKNEYEAGRYESYDYAVDMIEDADTIIEADKAKSEGKKEA